jgi:DNA-binding response OmpR family regulator
VVFCVNQKRRVLVIDDDERFREAIRRSLMETYEVQFASEAETGIHRALAEPPDVILLDIRMPGMDGVAACDLLRNNPTTREIPVIMMTGSGDDDERVQAFMNGADDLIQKPFRAQELSARIAAKLRRVAERNGEVKSLACGNLVLDLGRIEARVDSKLVPLSVLEFSLLKFFVQNQGDVISRSQILKEVWKDCIVSDRTVDSHVVSLRRKLAGSRYSLVTVYAAGYAFREVPAESSETSEALQAPPPKRKLAP